MAANPLKFFGGTCSENFIRPRNQQIQLLELFKLAIFYNGHEIQG